MNNLSNTTFKNGIVPEVFVRFSVSSVHGNDIERGILLDLHYGKINKFVQMICYFSYVGCTNVLMDQMTD